jgi:cell fate (sporulation/competence/biofilm development) regulator YlbF (YheA/YmcA/DUF963 family)
MNKVDLNDLEVASLEVVTQAARDFAAALAATPEFLAFEAAGEKLDQDPAAQDAIQSFQAKQEELKMMQSLNAVTPKEREEFECLRKAFLNQPSIAAYLQAQAGLAAVCQAAGDLLSEQTGLNFASSACASGCCG